MGYLRSLSHENQCADPLAVQSHYFGVTLTHHKLKPQISEEADRVRVLVEVPGGVTQVRQIEDGKVVLFLADICDLLPLFFTWVDSCRNVMKITENFIKYAIRVKRLNDK